MAFNVTSGCNLQEEGEGGGGGKKKERERKGGKREGRKKKGVYQIGSAQQTQINR